MPTTEVILKFGAKESLHLISGEWWRLFTPIFVHIGLIHFLFNGYAIYFLGVQLEPMVGKKWMAVVYIVSGIAGNIASAIFTIGISAGASSSIFGLLGLGWVFERAIGKHIEERTGQRAKRGMYTSLVTINLILGFFIPAIDNAAHIGGLVAGVFLAYGILFIMPNRVQKRRVVRGVAVMVSLLVIMAIGSHFSLSASFAAQRYEEFGDEVQNDPQSALKFYSRAIIAAGNDPALFVKRARLLVDLDELYLAKQDLKAASELPEGQKLVDEMLDFIKLQGRTKTYERLRDYSDVSLRSP